jgi:hypothetical protein
MAVIFTHGAGLDVHQKRMPADLLALSAWLAAAGVTHGAMESTGAYWKPVLNILAGSLTIFLVHAAHVTQVPGRTTDKADARGLA